MKNEIILFEDQNVKLEVNMASDTVWLNAEQMSQLFDRDYKTIRKHINNALHEELDSSTVAKIATVRVFCLWRLMTHPEHQTYLVR